MSKTHYDKLVRDRIPEIIHATGKNFEVVVMDLKEYEQALMNKLREETNELVEASPKERIKELADLYEVLEAVQLLWKINPDQVSELKKERANKRGKFVKRIKLLWVEDDE